MWASFDSLEDFVAWHEAIKQELGIPLPDGITTEYTEPVTLPSGEIVAWVDSEHTSGLIEGSAPIRRGITDAAAI